MSSKRKMVSTSLLTSKKMAMVSSDAERTFLRLYLASDSYGSVSGDPWDVALKCMPNVKGMDHDTVALALLELEQVGLVETWTTDGVQWWHIVGHDKHQSPKYLRDRSENRPSPIPPSQNGVRDDIECGSPTVRQEGENVRHRTVEAPHRTENAITVRHETPTTTSTTKASSEACMQGVEEEVVKAAEMLALTFSQPSEVWVDNLATHRSAHSHYSTADYLDAAAELKHQEATGRGVRIKGRELTVFRSTVKRIHEQAGPPSKVPAVALTGSTLTNRDALIAASGYDYDDADGAA